MPDWPHGPVHRLSEKGAYIITAGTYQKEHYFHDAERLNLLMDNLFKFSLEYEIKLQAWAILSNHYHFIAMTPEKPGTLKKLIQRLHGVTSKEINRMDGKKGRKVWFQYWDTKLTYERSYLARLKYVNYNPVHHGIVENALHYKWCSASWFENNADRSFFKRVKELKINRVNITDDF